MSARDAIPVQARRVMLFLRTLPQFRGRGRLIGGLSRLLRQVPADAVTCRTYHGDLLRIVPRACPVQRRIWEIGEWEAATTRLMQEILRPDDIFFDIGAHIGYFTCFAGRRLERGRVIAIEPYGPSFALLKANVELNGLTNVTVSNRAVWHSSGQAVAIGQNDVTAEHGTAGMYVLPSLPRSSQDTVVTITIDDLLDEINCDPPTIVKLDVEGAERAALQGAERLLREEPPILMIEASQGTSRRFNFSSTGLLRWLAQEHGYRLHVHVSGKYSEDPTLVAVSPEELSARTHTFSENVFCMIPDRHGDRSWVFAE